MSNKSNLSPAQEHKDINALIAEKNAKEQEVKFHDELVRQKKIINDDLLPFLYNTGKSITDIKVLINNTLKTLNTIFSDKMKEEQQRLSQTNLVDLGVPERMERDASLQLQLSLVDKVKNEQIGTATGILSGLHVLVAGAEAAENSQRELKELKLEV